MTKELKAKWVEALRSGKYNKCIGVMHKYLENGGAHCALGVLDLITGKSSFNVEHEYGISECIGNRIIQMNDKENKTFPEIADYIEKTL